MKEHVEWRRVRLVAYVWCCDDELDGLCYQPRITRYKPNERIGYPWLVLEKVWDGTFVNDPEPDEYERIRTELRTAAAERGIPLAERELSWPYGIIEEAALSSPASGDSGEGT